MKATIVDLRYRMKDVLGAIDRGETVTVMHRGKERARMNGIPPSSETSKKRTARTQDHPFFGMWKDREDMADPVAFVRKLRQERAFIPPFEKQESSKTKKRK